MNITFVKCFLFLFASFLCKNAAAQQSSNYFKQPVIAGELTDKSLSEVSGIVEASELNHFWVHNDSGDSSKIYLINSKAQLVKSFELESVHTIDCEDIARIVLQDVVYLVLGDIGDNLQRRSYVTLYIFPEPRSTDGSIIPKSKIRSVHLRYPGKRLDAESLMIDPISKTVYLISKREFRSTLYQAHIFDDRRKNNYTLQPVCQLPFTFATGGDIRADGLEIIIKNLVDVYFWKRDAGESVPNALNRRPLKIPYRAEPQGEAICFGLQKEGFYTLSERPFGLKSYLYFYSSNQ